MYLQQLIRDAISFSHYNSLIKSYSMQKKSDIHERLNGNYTYNILIDDVLWRCRSLNTIITTKSNVSRGSNAWRRSRWHYNNLLIMFLIKISLSSLLLTRNLNMNEHDKFHICKNMSKTWHWFYWEYKLDFYI